MKPAELNQFHLFMKREPVRAARLITELSVKWEAELSRRYGDRSRPYGISGPDIVHRTLMRRVKVFAIDQPLLNDDALCLAFERAVEAVSREFFKEEQREARNIRRHADHLTHLEANARSDQEFLAADHSLTSILDEAPQLVEFARGDTNRAYLSCLSSAVVQGWTTEELQPAMGGRSPEAIRQARSRLKKVVKPRGDA